MQDGVFQFARDGERPELVAQRVRGLHRCRHALRGSAHGDGGDRTRAVGAVRQDGDRILDPQC